jgi:hypothetical protein
LGILQWVAPGVIQFEHTLAYGSAHHTRRKAKINQRGDSRFEGW